MKTIILANIIVLWAVFLFSCKEKPERKVAIYPLSPYISYGSDSAGTAADSSSIAKTFVVYSLPKEKRADTVYLKNILKPFTDSVIHTSKQVDFQFEFYEKSSALDTVYRSTKYDPIDYHLNNLIADYYYSKKRRDSSWFFYDEEGQPIGKKVIINTISDIR